MRTAILCATVVLALAWAAPTLRASTVVGIFAIVDSVRLEPSDATPERIRMSGVFVIPVPMSSGHHRPPQRGQLCFGLPPGMEDAARKDWAAIQTFAGTGQVIGFGEYWVVTERRFWNSAMHTSLVVDVQTDPAALACEPYPVPNARGVVTTFDTSEDASPRFGDPSMVIVSRLLEAHRR